MGVPHPGVRATCTPQGSLELRLARAYPRPASLPPGGTVLGRICAPEFPWDQAEAGLPHTPIQSISCPYQASKALIPASPRLLMPCFSAASWGFLGQFQHHARVPYLSSHGCCLNSPRFPALTAPSLLAPASSALLSPFWPFSDMHRARKLLAVILDGVLVLV